MGHGHDSHGHGEPIAGIIPEGSLQDKALILIAFMVLVLMTISGFQWSLSVGAQAPQMPTEHGSEEHAE